MNYGLFICGFFIQFLITNWSKSNVFAWPDPDIRTKGEIWPIPQHFEPLTEKFCLIPEKFRIYSDGQCDIIQNAIDRYMKLIFAFGNDYSQGIPQNTNCLDELEIFFGSVCPKGPPQFEMDESYKLDISSSKGILKSPQVWGTLRGLESFSHLIVFNDSTGYSIQSCIVKDFPRFPHRGVLLDTSRHFLSVNAIKANLELMSQNKFNVFHWHIVDDQSFPYSSKIFPELSKGAYSPRHLYSTNDIKDIVKYARLRGIRVIPEFDTPGHMKSWGKGFPDLVAKCFNAKGDEIFDQSLIDPTKENTWDILLALFKEIFDLFPDNYMHLGGDETQFWYPTCWLNNKNITDFMKIRQLATVNDLEQYYFTTLIKLLENHITSSDSKSKHYVVWQEVLDMGIEVSGLIGQVWKGDYKKEMENITRRGHYAILSSCWYLDYLKGSQNWYDYYTCDPQAFNGSKTQKNLVLGGEAALWGEWVDESNVISRLWPRASAVGERLWSPREKTQNVTTAWPRLYEMQCRMAGRGYPVEPGYGPGYCTKEYRGAWPI